MGIIYKLYNPETNMCYIGSTKQTLIERLKRHLKHYKSYLNNKHNYIYSFKILETNNYKIDKIEDVEDNNYLKIREQYHINVLECVNKYKSYRTDKDIKEQQKKDNIKYKLKNPEKYKEHQNKRKIKILCSCGCEISKGNIARHLKTH